MYVAEVVRTHYMPHNLPFWHHTDTWRTWHMTYLRYDTEFLLTCDTSLTRRHMIYPLTHDIPTDTWHTHRHMTYPWHTHWHMTYPLTHDIPTDTWHTHWNMTQTRHTHWHMTHPLTHDTPTDTWHAYWHMTYLVVSPWHSQDVASDWPTDMPYDVIELV